MVRDVAAIALAAETGRGKLREQSFEVRNAIAAGDQVALEVLWSGTTGVAAGELAAGYVLRAHIATVLRFQDGKIVEQRNYDCYEPLAS